MTALATAPVQSAAPLIDAFVGNPPYHSAGSQPTSQLSVDRADAEHGVKTLDPVRIGGVARAVALSWSELWKRVVPFEVVALDQSAITGDSMPARSVRGNAAIAALKRMKLRTVLLTGDAADIGKRVDADLSVHEFYAEMLPHENLELQRNMATVGDRINDAPALAQAVGVAMGSGTEFARESADIVLLGNDLLKFVEALRIACRCRRIIRQNFAGTLVVDGAGVGWVLTRPRSERPAQ